MRRIETHSMDSTTPHPAPALLVVAAVILRHGKVLLTQREAGAHLALHWEFPGGKVEAGESPPEALRRELREELGIESEVEAPFAFNWHDYGQRRVLLLAYRTRIKGGEPRTLGCRGLGFFDASALRALRMPPADGPILERLLPLLDGA
jgi:8-oxo-dGTP diphosphatase